MFIISIKQLFRRPGKAVIFFLLMAASTALLAFAAVSTLGTNQRIDAVESQFSTIATVAQNRQPGDPLLHADILNFEGAEYVAPPETRPYYLTRTPGISNSLLHSHLEVFSHHVVEFTPLESGKGYTEPTKIQILKSYYNKFNHSKANWIGVSSDEKDLEPGDIAYFTQDFVKTPTPYETGKTYIANLYYNDSVSAEEEIPVYSVDSAPFTTQWDPELGDKMESAVMPSQKRRFDEVTENFWEPGNLGEIWMEWVEQLKLCDRYWLPVIPTNGVELIPTFHSRDVYMDSGRKITAEEFAGGSNVCMISDQSALSGVRIGDKINLSMCMAFYGFKPDRFYTFEFPLAFDFSPLNAQGEAYEPFWEKEYEVVGIYRQLYPGTGELYGEAIIVPSKSIKASDENNIVYFSPMNDWNTSFQIPNGKIAEFNTALHKAVPEASKLEIVYDDNGYEEVMLSLKRARLSSMLLLAVGVLSSLTVVVLLVYFFIVKERKRTAVERSLGLSKGRCRVSLMAGILVLALPAVAAGGWASRALGNMEQEGAPAASGSVSAEPEAGDMGAAPLEESMETAYFSRDYSLWAESEASSADIELDDEAAAMQGLLYFAVPGAMLLFAALLSLAAVNSSLRIEPILLLGGHGE